VFKDGSTKDAKQACEKKKADGASPVILKNVVNSEDHYASSKIKDQRNEHSLWKNLSNAPQECTYPHVMQVD